MPRLDFSFQGFIRGADVTRATTTAGETIDVTTLSAEELSRRLEVGDLTITLGDHLYTTQKVEIEIFDFTPAD